MISRSEIDLLNIRGEFMDLFDKSLHHMIEVRAHGHPSLVCHLVWLGPDPKGSIAMSGTGAEHHLGREKYPSQLQCWHFWL